MPRPFSRPTHEPALAREDRRARGVFYTPVEIAEWIVEQSYSPLLAGWNGDESPPRLLDPACGAGVFLRAARRSLEARCRVLRIDLQAAVKQAIHGIDIDAASVMTAREQAGLPATNITCADSLQVAGKKRFDVIVGNPPYVSIRELAKTHSPEQVGDLRDRFRTARGNFDLYVLFMERALNWLQPGGRLGFIVPNKWATLDYARALRKMLLEQTKLEQIVDLSSLRVFPQAGTYPQIILLQRQPATKTHRVKISSSISIENGARWIAQGDLQLDAFILGEEIRVEDRVPTVRLDSIATLHSGASGYSAQQLSEALQEAAEATSGEVASFIVSGNIDRYAIHLGNVRFLNRTWKGPVLPFDTPQLTALKKKLYREPKIVLSGMCRRLEAAYDEQGCALGVQVYAAAELQIDPLYLLGLLNSKLLSYLFRERFAAKRLAGGYLAINKGQLAQLPICLPEKHEKLQCTIVNLARQLLERPTAALDDALDAALYQLYQITPAEAGRIEASFAPTAAPQKRRVA